MTEELYNRIREHLNSPRRVSAKRCYSVPKSFDPLNVNELRNFITSLPRVQRAVFSACVLEKCEGLTPFVVPEPIQRYTVNNRFVLSPVVNGWIDKGFNEEAIDALSYNINNLLNDVRRQNTGFEDSITAYSHHYRRLFTLQAVYFAIDSLNNAGNGYLAVRNCASAFVQDGFLGRRIVRPAGTINEVVDRALSRLAFKDASTADLEKPVLTSPRSGPLHLF